MAFSPLDLPSLDCWLKADSLALSDGDPVGTWADQGPAGHDATQGTAGKKPLYKTNIINGLPVVRGDGTDDILSGTMTASTAKSILIVLKKRSAAGTAGKSAVGLGTTVNASIIFTDTDLGAGYLYFGTQVAGVKSYGGTPTNVNILGLRYTSATAVEGYVNGAPPSPASFDPNNDATTATTYNLFANNVGGSEQYGDYDIGEFIICSALLSDSDWDNAGQYLANRWGASWATVSGQPVYLRSIYVPFVGGRHPLGVH